MQEEVIGKSVALIVDGARMSEQVLEKALRAYLDARKNKQPKIYRGKQSLKHLAQQNAGLANIEISDKNIKAFTQVAKKYKQHPGSYQPDGKSGLLRCLPGYRG